MSHSKFAPENLFSVDDLIDANDVGDMVEAMPTFYDHVANQTNPAAAEAMARVRREAIAEGNAYRVEANWPGQGRFYWNGGRYDVLRLATELTFNRAERVEMTGPDKLPICIRSARY